MDKQKLRIGVVGLGRAFTLMLPTFLADSRVELVAGCDPRAAARDQFTKDFSRPAYDSVEALAADRDVEVVYIASPHQYHAQHTRIAAGHRKHVLVEKPMALSLAECDAMIGDCDQAGVHLLIGHCHSFDTPYLKTRELVRSGRFGAVRMIHALNFTDYLCRPRRPEELQTSQGGGAVFSQAAHQVDIVRLLACQEPERVRSALGNWDPSRPTEGAYSALMWFHDGAYASFNYNGYGHFDSDEWMGWTGEMGQRKSSEAYGNARRRLKSIANPEEESALKNAGTYGGSAYQPPGPESLGGALHQHFGPVLVSCEKADLRPLPNGISVYEDEEKYFIHIEPPKVPRAEVIDELHAAVRTGAPCLHDGRWARRTLEICLAMIQSSNASRDVVLSGAAGGET
ncbi:4,5-dihydroxyphthalate dehydrogenase [Achromobacter sp. Root83]|uniref:Gfo/Idh/MocA family protein n=1 Tax=Achromobacter sp. Root83 TaxID=1736602 RepID=UPI00070DD869|nr:Gfo/Idh/MocA family oxidoreductase [Achromobacter sp. Root83]KRC77861.1 4,5-dihydroxyphthalate dehydrogenase [Achromobacter sp. Root83]